MATISYIEPELVVALDKKVIFVNPNDLQIFKEVLLPEDLTKCGLEVPTSTEKLSKNAQEQSEEELPNLQQVALSPNRLLLAVTTLGQKAVLLYKLYPVHAKLISVRSLVRASSAVTFSSDSKNLLVTDKTGDCYEFDCVNVDAAPRLLFGHLSLIFDVLWSPDSKHIITCDRDDKIRVTNYPDSFDIHGYCLGHKEFVSGIALLEDDFIVSVSGDSTLRLWNYKTCQQILRYDLPAPATRLTVQPVSDKTFQAAVLLLKQENSEEFMVAYNIVRNTANEWEVRETDISYSSHWHMSDVCFAKERIYLVGSKKDRLALHVTSLGDSPSVPEHWLEMVEEQFAQQVVKPNSYMGWFKKHYDNVSEYLERKKRRIEEKQK